eukprot:PITA_08091
MCNNIPYIQKLGGERVEQHEEIEKELLNHFKQVHQEPDINRCPAVERIICNVPKLITAEHNELLLSPIQIQEVDVAMAQLKEGKAPSPDDFTTTFFHKFWELIKLEVWDVAEESHVNHRLLPSLNSTFIALIPNEEDSIKPDKFRPIALCNVIYKVISKVIAKRLKPLLPMLISPEQPGYVEGRQIMDGIILSHEIIHTLKHSKQAGMLLKLDLSKAFDKLSWDYVQQMLTSFGFSPTWIRWIFFFNTPPVVKSAIVRILGFPIATLPSKYLGAPLTVSAIKHSSWRNLIEKLESRLNQWTHRALNLFSRTVLIKVVLQAMPLYLFSILAAPKWVLKRLRNIQRGFPWGSNATNRKWALVKWSTICKPKAKGGIGLRDPEHSNTIMGAKIWWQWLTNPGKPWVTLWTSKYANHRPQEELIRLRPNDKGSLIWNASKEHYQMIQQHSFWEVRNGHTTRFWIDTWNQMPILSNVLNLPPDIIGEETRQAKIRQYWTQESEQGFRIWKLGNHVLTNEDLQISMELERELSKRKIRYDESRDILRWGYQLKGTFTTSEAYKIICNDSVPQDPIWSKIWSSSSWPKICHFLWLVGHQRVLTWDKLRIRNFHDPSIYFNCNAHEETLQHLLDSCPLANQLWEKASFQCQRRCRLENEITNTIRQWQQDP